MNKFLSDIDTLTSPLIEVINKILITYCYSFNIAINSLCYDIIDKKVNTVFFVVITANAKSGPRNQDKKKQVNSL